MKKFSTHLIEPFYINARAYLSNAYIAYLVNLTMANKITSFNTFQKQFINWMLHKKRGFLQAPMGVGKTLALTGFFAIAKRQNPEFKRLLVITNTKAMKAIDKANFQHLQVTKINSASDLHLFYRGNSYSSDIYCISPRCLAMLVDPSNPERRKAFTEFLSGVNLLSVDETHNFCNYKSTISRALSVTTNYFQKLVDDTQGLHRIIAISGTPVKKNLVDWYSMMSYVEPALFGTYYNFLDRYCVLETRNTYTKQKFYTMNGSAGRKRSFSFQEIVGYKNIDDLYNKLSDYVFTYSETDFTFNFKLHGYNLTEPEVIAYNKVLEGLGLSKAYTIKLLNAKGEFLVYRDPSDIFYDLSGREVLTVELHYQQAIRYDNLPTKVIGIYDRKTDATYSTRMIQAQRSNSAAKNKLKKLLELVQAHPSGLIIYCCYHDTVKTVHQYLITHGVQKRIVVITGETQNASAVVDSLGPNDVAIITRAASESLDFYYNKMIFYELAGLPPGTFSQALGRVTRNNSPYREIDVDMIVRESCVEEYFYERLRLLLKTDKNSIYQHSLPPSKTLSNFSEDLIDIKLLKEQLLWNPTDLSK